MQANRLSHVTSVVAGVAKCPYSPHHNATYIMTSDANLYTATVTDFTARDPAIYRMMGGAKYLRTAQYNSRWLNGKFCNCQSREGWEGEERVRRRYGAEEVEKGGRSRLGCLFMYPRVPSYATGQGWLATGTS